jgi:hypothetical protein
MRIAILGCLSLALLLMLPAVGVAQQAIDVTAQSDDRVVQDPAAYGSIPNDISQIGSEADAAVLAKFTGARGQVQQRRIDDQLTVDDLVTTLSFDVVEIVKNHSRLPASGNLDVYDGAGGGEYTKSTPHKVLRLSPGSEQFVVGHTYFLYLSWFEPKQAYTLSAGPASTFDVTGPKVAALVDLTEFGKRAPSMGKAAAIQELRDAAMAVRPARPEILPQ